MHIPSYIIIPSGRCPHLLEGTDKKSVSAWVSLVNDSSPAGVTYAKSALRYWIRDTYDINGPDFKAAAASLDILIDD